MSGLLDCDVCGHMMMIREATDKQGNKGRVATCTSCKQTIGLETWVIIPTNLTPEKIEAVRNINR